MVSNSIFIIMILTFEGSVYSQFFSAEKSYQGSHSYIYYSSQDSRTFSNIGYGYTYNDNTVGFVSTAETRYDTYMYTTYTADTSTTTITIISSTVYSESGIYNATVLYDDNYGYTTETVTDVISIVSTSTDAIIYVPTVINNYSEYATINTTTLAESQLSTISSTLTVENRTYSFIASFYAESVRNTYVYASEGFYIASNSSYSAIFQSPTTTYTSSELFPIITSYTRSVIDLSRRSETSLYTETVFDISYEGDTPYTTFSLVSVVNSFPQTTDGTYSLPSRHLSTTLITTQTVTDFLSNRGVAFSYVFDTTSTETFYGGTTSFSSGETYMPGDTVKKILDNVLLLTAGGIAVSSYVGSGIDIPSAGWSYSDRTSIPAWFSGGAEISLDGNLFDYISTSIIVPSIGTRYAEKEDSSFTVSIDSLFRCSSTWRYPVGTSTQTSSATMQLEAQGTNPLFINTANDILGGYPEINHSYTFVRGPGAFAVTNGDAYGFTTTTQSFTNTGATSFSSTMNNTITEITQYPLILGLSALPIMTYDF